MSKILVLCAANPATNPRPNRMIEILKRLRFEVSAMGIDASPMEGVEVFDYPAFKKRNFFEELRLVKNVFSKNRHALIHTPNREKIAEVLRQKKFDLIICHDLVLLPIVFENKGKAKILFDAREFYPGQNTTNLRWKLLFADFNDWLCRTFLPLCDCVITVSNGLKETYGRLYGIECEIFHSLPPYFGISPPPLDPKCVKIIHHGAANRNRHLENMVEISRLLEPRFCLDLMLVQTDSEYMRFLEKTAQKARLKGAKIRIVPPVPHGQIIPFTSNHDLGLYAIPPNTLNLKHALPNKFFEYVQAALALVITPNQEMTPFLDEFQNGAIAKDFTPQSVANAINSLTSRDVETFRKNSAKAAKILNLESNKDKLEKILSRLLD